MALITRIAVNRTDRIISLWKSEISESCPTCSYLDMYVTTGYGKEK